MARQDSGALQPARVDLCLCESALRCPNGTTSLPKSSSIYNCVKTGYEVLRRYVPIPRDFPHLMNTSASAGGYRQSALLRDLYEDRGDLPFVDIKGGQQLVVTMNLTQLSVNFTYNDHYQLAVYADCLPCPPRYTCSFLTSPPSCGYPSLADQQAYGYTCDTCCACQNLLFGSPYWSANNVAIYPHLDNKHGLVTHTFTALYSFGAGMLVCLELLHGQFYKEFDAELQGVTYAYMHSPSRAAADPGGPRGASARKITLA